MNNRMLIALLVLVLVALVLASAARANEELVARLQDAVRPLALNHNGIALVSMVNRTGSVRVRSRVNGKNIDSYFDPVGYVDGVEAVKARWIIVTSQSAESQFIQALRERAGAFVESEPSKTNRWGDAEVTP